jgi:hypothetical protein
MQTSGAIAPRECCRMFAEDASVADLTFATISRRVRNGGGMPEFIDLDMRAVTFAEMAIVFPASCWASVQDATGRVTQSLNTCTPTRSAIPFNSS